MCQHTLQPVQQPPQLSDGRQPMTVYCTRCARQWACESISFAPMGQAPQWTPKS